MLKESEKEMIRKVLLNAGISKTIINLELDRLDMMTKEERDLYLDKGCK